MSDHTIDNWMVSMDARSGRHPQRNFPAMTCFLTFLTFLMFLTAWQEWHGYSVRNVRKSDKSDCAYGDKSIFFSLSFSRRVFPSRARKQICQKTPILIQLVSARHLGYRGP